MKFFQRKSDRELTTDEVLDDFRTNPMRWLVFHGGGPLFKQADYGVEPHFKVHREVSFPTVYAKPHGCQIGTIRNVRIELWTQTAYFTHFGIEKSATWRQGEFDVRGRGVASAMLRSFLLQLRGYYGINFAIFDETKLLGEGDYESFLIKSLGAVRDEVNANLFSVNLELPFP